MTPRQDNLQPENEDTYDRLISLIENSQGRLSPIIVACDDQPLRQKIIQRYEAEARQAQIRSYRIVLGQEPSVRAGLAALRDKETHLQQGGEAVFTVTGAELLLRVKLDPQTAQSELDKFFGYLQWTREGLREFPYPIVLWVSYRILHELSRRAPDFWSWRKAVLRFAEESPQTARTAELAHASFRQDYDFQASNDPLPPPNELETEIAELTAKDPNAPGLATLYDRLGQVYAQQIRQGLAQNLAQAREQTIATFQAAIRRYHDQANPAAEMVALRRLGNFLDSQSRYQEAIDHFQKALAIAQKIDDRDGEASALGGLGGAYESLGEYYQAIELVQKSLDVSREIGNRDEEATCLNNIGHIYFIGLGKYHQAIEFYQRALAVNQALHNRYGESANLCNLAHAYLSLGQHKRAIDLYQQALETDRELDKPYLEPNALSGLGSAYSSLGEYQRAIDLYQQSLDIFQAVGDRHGEAKALFNQALSLAKLDQPWPALQAYQRAKEIYAELGLDHEVERCSSAIYSLNRIIPAQVSHAPPIRDEASPPRRRFRLRRQQVFWMFFGVVLVLLLWWLAGL